MFKLQWQRKIVQLRRLFCLPKAKVSNEPTARQVYVLQAVGTVFICEALFSFLVDFFNVAHDVAWFKIIKKIYTYFIFAHIVQTVGGIVFTRQ